MPTYDFQCTEETCRAHTTRDLRVDDRDDPLDCEYCGKPMRRQFSPPAITKMLKVGKRRHT